MIPEPDGNHLVADRKALLQALRRIAILSNRKTHGIRLAPGAGVLELSAENPDQEQASEEVPVTYDGDPTEIGFNVEYLQQAVGAVPTEEVVLHLWDPQS
ncbi:MAG: DNA polymerase III subunit beta, partial [Thiohalorhabdaceae bacterium]